VSSLGDVKLLTGEDEAGVRPDGLHVGVVDLVDAVLRLVAIDFL